MVTAARRPLAGLQVEVPNTHISRASEVRMPLNMACHLLKVAALRLAVRHTSRLVKQPDELLLYKAAELKLGDGLCDPQLDAAGWVGERSHGKSVVAFVAQCRFAWKSGATRLAIFHGLKFGAFMHQQCAVNLTISNTDALLNPWHCEPEQ